MIAPALRDAHAQHMAGKHHAARVILLRYLAAKPKDPDALCLLADVCASLGEPQQALRAADRALAAAPGAPHAGMAHIRALAAADRWDDALSRASDLCHGPGVGLPAAWKLRADLLLRAGTPSQSVACLRQGLARCDGDESLLLSLAFAQNVAGCETPAQEREVHETLARLMGPPLPRRWPNTPDPQRPLNLAILSADLRLHSCAFFLAGWLPHLDRHATRLFLYSTGADDDTSARFKALGAWRSCARLSPAELAELAARDAIDVLIDANGWTAPGHMRALATGIAPVQATFLGYPGTTGLQSVSWRLVDETTDPAGSESHCTERLWRIEGCLWNFAPDPAWPQPAATPVPQPRVTFGSFNHAAKVGERCMTLWGRVLNAVPGAELVVKSPPGVAATAPWLARLESRVGAGRVRVLPHVPETSGHLALYAEMDIALDPAPYNGTTTTCEAIWMGVPVVTIAGDRHRSRVGASLLVTIGLPDLVAPDDDAFVSLAAGLATDAPRLAALRANLRSRMARSPLCDGPAYAQQFERSVRGMWKEWCGRATAP
jgi:protein O-GlcNAc transferase